MERILCEMGIARCRLDIAAAKQLPDYRKGLSERQRTGCEGMAEVLRDRDRRYDN